MENRQLLRGNTYWSRPINDRSNRVYESRRFTDTRLQYPNKYSKINSNYRKVNYTEIINSEKPNNGCLFAKTAKGHPRESFVKDSMLNKTECDSSKALNTDDNGILTVTLVPNMNRTVYINRNVLPLSSQIMINNDVGDTQKKPSGIYYNPKFVKLSSSVQEKEEFHLQKNKPKNVAFNPAFFKSSSKKDPVTDEKKSSVSLGVRERVYVNPKFLKPEPSPISPVVDGRAIHPAATHSDLSQSPSIKHKMNKLIIGKHKLIRRRSVSVSLGTKSPSKIVTKYTKVNNQVISSSKKLQLVVEKKLKLRNERLKTNPKLDTQNKEFQGSKYSIRRCKPVLGPDKPSSLEPQPLDLPSKTPKLRRNSFKLAVTRQEVSKCSSLSDSFRLIGKTKLLRKSVLQSHIVARRSLTNSRFKFTRNLINSDKVTPPVQTSSVYKFSRDKNENFSLAKKTLKVKSTTAQNSKKSFVNIDGVIYRSTHNKLTRRDISRGSVVTTQRGVKFSSVKSGRASARLRRVSLASSSNRINVSRLTSVNLNKSYSNVRSPTIIITNSRMRLRLARQKSMAVLTAKLRKCNQPCLFYNRFGYCKRKENSTCEKVHDPKLIAVCKKYLRGECTSGSCLLSHSLLPEKMPVCYHFLKGGCVRDNCPFLHVKHNSKTPICLAFLEGYCPSASTCRRRHEYICPKYSETGACPKGEKCSYPHPSNRTDTGAKPKLNKKLLQLEKKNRTKGASSSGSASTSEVGNVRYFVGAQSLNIHDYNLSEEEGEHANKDVIVVEDSDDEFVPEDTKRLPQYIPLDQTLNPSNIEL